MKFSVVSSLFSVGWHGQVRLVRGESRKTTGKPKFAHATHYSPALLLLLLISACNKPPAVNMIRDDSIPPSEWSTPSQDGILSADKPAAIHIRELPTTPAPLARETVPHYPLWWEDPFEDKGDGNHQFSWTWADVAAVPYSLGRYILNTIAWPVSAVVTPPGTPMVSDGQLSPGGIPLEHHMDHDAARGSSPNPVASADDFGPEIAQTAPAP